MLAVYTPSHEGQGYQQTLAAQVMISKEVLFSETLREQLINAYRMDPSKPELFLLWIDSFTEHELSADQLSAYVSFVEQLAANGSAVVNLYGGYFSVATARFGSLQRNLWAFVTAWNMENQNPPCLLVVAYQ